MGVLAYFITFHTYGSWLHGRDKGSVDDEHSKPGLPLLPPNQERERWEENRLKHPPVELDAERRFVVDQTIKEVCEHRQWPLHALNVRTTHVHAVVSSDHKPERVMNDFKAYCTRRMRETGVFPANRDAWSYHGSTRWIDTQESFTQAVDYVTNQQGAPLARAEPSGWSTIARKQNHEPRA